MHKAFMASKEVTPTSLGGLFQDIYIHVQLLSFAQLDYFGGEAVELYKKPTGDGSCWLWDEGVAP